jgi:hypothetical protein
LARQTRTSSSGLRSGARTRTMIDTGAKDALAGCRRARTWRTRKAETVQVHFKEHLKLKSGPINPNFLSLIFTTFFAIKCHFCKH